MADYVNIILPILTTKVPEFRLGFLAEHPKEEGYTDLQWLKKELRTWAIREYKRGKKKLAYEALAVDENIIE